MKKYIDSAEEAEDFVLKIFDDLWKFADLFDPSKQAEDYFVFLIAYRQLNNSPRLSIAALPNGNDF
ncbi:MAG: hypothetical protein M3388_02820 [Acidobacteriota bacterium]|nr:hypothetical protein [Acidobacteriota bacterium]